MNWCKLRLALLGLGLASACGGSPDPKSTNDVVVDDSERVIPMFDPEEPGIPRRCVSRKGLCLPPADWAQNLCEDVYEDLALYLFRKGTPWKRVYLATDLNAVGGWGTTLHEDMKASEEVLVVAHRGNNEMVQVEGSAGTYDVLRWNGNCVSVDVNQVSTSPEFIPLNSSIDWWKLSDDMRSHLLRDGDVKSEFELDAKACKGASIGRASNDCESVHKGFMKSIAVAVRRSQSLPLPSETPAEQLE